LVIPLSTQIKSGSWYSKFIFQGKEQIAMLSQIKIIDHKRLISKIGRMELKDFDQVSQDLQKLYFPNKNISPQEEGTGDIVSNTL
jgi:PemK-like, MazF-like toxin of type II toxin-antitoxin system